MFNTTVKISRSEYDDLWTYSNAFKEAFGTLVDLRTLPEGYAREFDYDLVVMKKDVWYNYCKIRKEVSDEWNAQEENARLKEENAKFKTDAEFWKYRYLKLRDELEDFKTGKNI